MSVLIRPGFMGRLAGTISAAFGQIRPIFAPLLTTLRDTFSGTSAEVAIRASTATVEVYDAPNAPILKTAQINEARRVGMRRVENLARYTDTPTTQNIVVVVGSAYQISIGASSAAGSTVVCSGAFTGTLTGDGATRQQFAPAKTATTTILTLTTTGSVKELQVENVTGQTVTTAGDYVSRDAAKAGYPELVTNGTFDADVAGWSGVGGAILSHDAGGNGGRLKLENGLASQASCYQMVATKIGTRYVCTFTLADGTATSGIFRIGTAPLGADYSTVSYTAGTYSVVFVPTTTTTYITMFSGSAVLNGYNFWDSISIKEATTGIAYFPTDPSGNPLNPTKDMNGCLWTRSIADWTPATYAVDKECNYLGYWYKSTGGTDTTTFNDGGSWVQQGLYSKKYGVLVEETRTNDIGQSTNITAAGWTAAAATATATTVREDTTTVSHYSYYTYPAAVATGNRVISCEATNLSGTRYLVLRHTGIGLGKAFAAFDLVNGTVFATGGTEFVRASITPTHDGRYLCELAANHAIAPIGYSVVISNDGTELPSYIGNGTSGFNIWNHQSEAGLVASSRIEATGGAAVTRSEEMGNVKWSNT